MSLSESNNTNLLGRTVHYVLTGLDAQVINSKRINLNTASLVPQSAQAHIGTEVKAGQECVMIVVAVLGPAMVNGQVLLDGNDVLWVTSVSRNNKGAPGTWHDGPVITGE